MLGHVIVTFNDEGDSVSLNLEKALMTARQRAALAEVGQAFAKLVRTFNSRSASLDAARLAKGLVEAVER